MQIHYSSLLNLYVSQSISQAFICMQLYKDINHAELIYEIKKRLKNMAEPSQSGIITFSDTWSQYCFPSAFLKRMFE